MQDGLIISLAIIGVALLWLNIVALFVLKHDHTLNIFQKITQSIFVLILPFLGATVVLRLAYQHLPEDTPRPWLPWPFRGMVFEKDSKRRRNDNNTALDDFTDEPHTHFRSHTNDVDGD